MAIAFAPLAFSQSGLVGRKTGDGQIRFQAVEELQIEGGHRVRLIPITAQTITPEDAKRLPHEELAQIGTLRADSGHRLVRLNDAGKPSELVLPDNFAPKTPVDAASAQGRLAILAIQSKKAKNGEPIAAEEFFVFVSGPEPDRLALALVNRSAVFADLDEQFAAMEGLVASFPDSPVKADLRAQLQDRIAGGLAAFENHGAYDDLLLTRRYADLGGRAFPGEAALGQLSTRISTLIQTLASTRLKLASLAAAGEWDLLLDAYLPFEHYQWSFPDAMALRQTAFEESARLHAHRASLLAERQLHAEALAEFNRATSRDPDNREIAKSVDAERVAGSPADANASSRRVLSSGSPQDIRFKRSLHDGERAIQDKDYAKAESSIKEAQAENKDAPEILLLQARLLAARDRGIEALPLLDAYTRAVSTPAERDAGNTARNDILYEMEKKRTAFQQQLQKLKQDGDYSKLREIATQALSLDPDDEDFLYYAGVTSALFHDPAAGRERLTRYLGRSNSLRGDLEARDRAFHIRALLDAPAFPQSAGMPNWLSGKPVPEGDYYCPVSGAFQIPIDNIAGYKLKMAFQWEQNRLTGISSTFDDEKGVQNYRALGGPAGSLGNFFFGYAGEDPQVQVASTIRFDGPITPASLRVTHDGPSPHLVDERGGTRLLLRDSPQFDTAVLAGLEGPLSTGIAGNPYFNPFIWDGLHYFTLTYDTQGHLATAREWNADNLVRFTWSAGRLIEIRAFRKESSTPYYQRTISYSGPMIVGESYSMGSKTGQIKYVYSGKVLQQVKMEDGGVHDGKTWTVRLRQP